MKAFDLMLAIIAVLASLTAPILLIDFFLAVGAEACSKSAVPGCYPWGSEGPAADYWTYRSKSIYLASGMLKAIVPPAILVSLFWFRGRLNWTLRLVGITGLAVVIAMHLI